MSKLKLRTSVIVAYHVNCADGLVAAALLDLLITTRANLVNQYELFFCPMDYNKASKEALSNTMCAVVDEAWGDNIEVWMVDFCIEQAEIQAYIDTVDNLTFTVLDHHATAFDMMLPETNLNETSSFEVSLVSKVYPNSHALVKIDKDKSGAGLCLDLLSENNLTDWGRVIVQHVQDRDLWKFELPESKANHMWICHHFLDDTTLTETSKIRKMAELLTICEAGLYGNLIYSGQRRLREHNELIHNLALTAKPVAFGINKYGERLVPAVQCDPKYSSDVGNALAELELNGLAACYHTPSADNLKLSFRSREGAPITAQDIATHFGGGGHKHAAGVELTGRAAVDMLDTLRGTANVH